MATVLRNTSPDVASIAACCNALKLQIGAGSSPHLDASEMTIVAADATDLPSALALLNATRACFQFHKADVLAHITSDTATLTAPAATDLASGITLANELKGDYNTHRASTAWHYNADSTNATTATNASDLASLETLANELKADMNAHWGSASAPASCAPSFRVVSA